MGKNYNKRQIEENGEKSCELIFALTCSASISLSITMDEQL